MWWISKGVSGSDAEWGWGRAGKIISEGVEEEWRRGDKQKREGRGKRRGTTKEGEQEKEAPVVFYTIPDWILRVLGKVGMCAFYFVKSGLWMVYETMTDRPWSVIVQVHGIILRVYKLWWDTKMGEFHWNISKWSICMCMCVSVCMCACVWVRMREREEQDERGGGDVRSLLVQHGPPDGLVPALCLRPPI